ncbi:MAG: dihydropyrimidinase [Chloroflexi bacterium]|nr:dihydropyrimidinase [Chloroflexota bacterium]
MEFDLVIAGGTCVSITAAETIRADVGVIGDTIAALGHGLTGAARIDATGKLVLPGAVDPHVHLDMPVGATRSSDDWETGTIAAACGGTTTVIDFVEPDLGGSLVAGLAARRAEADGKAVIDYGLHMTLRRGDAQTLDQVPEAMRAGCTSFKTYTTYEGFRLNDAELLAALEAVGAAGGLVLVHAENDAAIQRGRRKFMAAGQTAPHFHPRSRPVPVEAEAIERALALAEVADCPLYIVHTSTGRGAEAIARARARGQRAYGETCPQYLVLTDAEYDRPGFEGAKFVCSPPLRPADNPPLLWQRLGAGDLQTVGTDHCPFFYEGQKELGRAAFTDIPNGLPGIEARLALLYTFGVGQGRLSLNRWVEVCCAAPARIFGLYPRKGTLAPGADADIVIFDPDREVTLSRAVLHERTDYTPYEGLALRGYPVMTVARGRVLVEDGKFVGAKGRGRFLARKLS